MYRHSAVGDIFFIFFGHPSLRALFHTLIVHVVFVGWEKPLGAWGRLKKTEQRLSKKQLFTYVIRRVVFPSSSIIQHGRHPSRHEERSFSSCERLVRNNGTSPTSFKEKIKIRWTKPGVFANANEWFRNIQKCSGEGTQILISVTRSRVKHMPPCSMGKFMANGCRI